MNSSQRRTIKLLEGNRLDKEFWTKELDSGRITEEDFRFVTATTEKQFDMAAEKFLDRLGKGEIGPEFEYPKAASEDEIRELLNQEEATEWLVDILAKCGMAIPPLTPRRVTLHKPEEEVEVKGEWTEETENMFQDKFKATWNNVLSTILKSDDWYSDNDYPLTVRVSDRQGNVLFEKQLDLFTSEAPWKAPPIMLPASFPVKFIVEGSSGKCMELVIENLKPWFTRSQ